MRKNTLRQLLNSDKPSLATRIMSTWPTIIELVGHTNLFDYVEFAGEYTPYSLMNLDNMARATEVAGLSSMIKVDKSAQSFLAQRALGSGIQNVLFTDVKTSDDARKCVQAIRAENPESGGTNPCTKRRSFLPDESGTPQFVRAMDHAIVAIMIEKQEAMENLEQILSVNGLDMVQFGPCDFAMSIGLPGQLNHKKVKGAEKSMIRMARKKGVAPRVEISTPEESHKYMKLGVKHYSLNTDIEILKNWLQTQGKELRVRLSNHFPENVV